MQNRGVKSPNDQSRGIGSSESNQRGVTSPLLQGRPNRKLTVGGSFKNESWINKCENGVYKNNYSPGQRNESTRKIRYLIQKHFLTGFPHSKKKPQTRFDFVFIAKMAVLNRYLDHILPERQGRGNIGLAYRRLGSNLYKNKYYTRMQDLIQSKIKIAITMSVRALAGLSGNQNQSMFSKAKMPIQPAQQLHVLYHQLFFAKHAQHEDLHNLSPCLLSPTSPSIVVLCPQREYHWAGTTLLWNSPN